MPPKKIPDNDIKKALEAQRAEHMYVALTSNVDALHEEIRSLRTTLITFGIAQIVAVLTMISIFI